MNNLNCPILYIIIPCYNESEVLPITSGQFLEVLKKLVSSDKISDCSRILFVNDGSNDNTWEIIKSLSNEDPHYCGISQSRNRGHQNAVLAGLMEAKPFCDITISIDCDGQDDASAMESMVENYINGSDIVYGVRSKRDTDTFFKRFTAEAYYKILNKMGAEVVFNHADYRLVSSRVLDELSNYKEVNLFLRGLFPLIGFNSSIVYYERNERIAGSSHYPLKKMISLAVDGITSLSIKPLRIITVLGIVTTILSFIATIWAFLAQISGKTVQGWASTMCILCFLGSIQLISIGVLGEYIGKIYLEVKERPRYIISDRTDNIENS